MSEKDSRFSHPLEFVKEHVLGCFEASKACALLPGKPHLYHAEFLARTPEAIAAFLEAGYPVDYLVQIHLSPCEEVSWYLDTRKSFPTYEGSSQADPEFVKDNAPGVLEVIPELSFAQAFEPLSEEQKAEWMQGTIAAHAAKLSALAETLAPTTPEISKDSVTATNEQYPMLHGKVGEGSSIKICQLPYGHDGKCDFQGNYGKGKKSQSRFDKITKELKKVTTEIEEYEQ